MLPVADEEQEKEKAMLHNEQSVNGPSENLDSAMVRRIASVSRRHQQPATSSEVVSLAVGEPDFITPQVIRDAAGEALNKGLTHYAPQRGLALLRESVIARLLREHPTAAHNLDVENVLVTQGGTAGLASLILALVGPGDRVVIPDPTYSLYADLVAAAGGELVRVPLADDLHWDLERLAKALVGARMFIYCNPSNPTGVVHTREELECVADMVRDSSTLVLADEAYSDLVFSDQPFTSVLDVERFADRAILCQTFSKSYAMTGWRLGYIVASSAVIDAANRMHATFNGSVATSTQYAGAIALQQGDASIAAMRETYRVRRRQIIDGLREIAELRVTEPEGAFYVFPQYDLGRPSEQVVKELHAAGVAVRAGSEFGPHGEGSIRLSYAASSEDIAIALERLKEYFAKASAAEKTAS